MQWDAVIEAGARVKLCLWCLYILLLLRFCHQLADAHDRWDFYYRTDLHQMCKNLVENADVCGVTTDAVVFMQVEKSPRFFDDVTSAIRTAVKVVNPLETFGDLFQGASSALASLTFLRQRSLNYKRQWQLLIDFSCSTAFYCDFIERLKWVYDCSFYHAQPRS